MATAPSAVQEVPQIDAHLKKPYAGTAAQCGTQHCQYFQQNSAGTLLLDWLPDRNTFTSWHDCGPDNARAKRWNAAPPLIMWDRGCRLHIEKIGTG